MKHLALIFVGLAGLLLSCSKKLTPSIPPPSPSLEIEEINFDYFHAKAKLVFRDEKKEQGVKAHIRIRKDSVIWMTFTGLAGVQGGRALINRDSVTIVSSVDKEYYVFDYKELSKRYNMDINYLTIQAAILGNLISPRAENDKITQGPSHNILEQQRANVMIKNFINAASKKLEKVEMKEPNTSNSVVITYENFQPVGDKSYAFNGTININYKTSSGLVNNTIILEYNKAEVGDKELKFPFNIPRKYDRR
ncbi:MAG TPA: DUF4292 domain-containing protein [Cyclobacteriaceae bacterium]|nr:DUF4292 domain-containing protein [Cyclobacteriaceae bacterium]